MFTKLTNDMTFEEYKALKALNQSGMKLLLESPRKYWDEKINPNPPTKNVAPAKQKSYDIGTAVHSLVLLGITPFEQPAHIKPRTEAGKEWIAKTKASLPEGQMLMDKATIDVVNQMAESVFEDEAAVNILRGDGERHLVEQNLAFNYQFGPLPDDTIPCKARLDIVKQYCNGVHICDLKTTKSLKPDSFERDAYNFGYHMQAAFYMHAAAAVLDLPVGSIDQEFSIISVESVRPYRCRAYTYSAKSVRQGQRAVDEAIRLFLKYRHMEDPWPSFDIEDEALRGRPTILEIPVWARDEQYHEEPPRAVQLETQLENNENPY